MFLMQETRVEQFSLEKSIWIADSYGKSVWSRYSLFGTIDIFPAKQSQPELFSFAKELQVS